MADKGALQEIQEKLKKIWGKIKMLAFVYLILLLLAFVLCIIVYFMVSNSPGTFTVGKETFRTDGKFILEKSIYQNFENLLLGGVVNDIPQGGIRRILYDLRHNILFNYQFRTLAILVAVLATAMMGLSMLTGDQKITVKEFAMDVLIIFGSTGLLLSPDVELYIDFFYNIITSSAKWIMHLSMSALYKVTAFEYVNNNTSEPNIYAPLDIVASIFFDEEIATRVRKKLVGLMFGSPTPYIQYVPILGLCMVYAWFLTINVFLAFIMAKVTILFALQALPFFILFAAINDVKIKLAKKGKSKSFLWNLIEVGIFKPWVYLALMSFMAGLLFYILIVQNIENMMNFSVYVTKNYLAWIKSLPVVGKAISTVIHTSVPRASGVDHDTFVMNMIMLIFGMIIFKYAFETLTQLVNALSFALGEGSHFKNLFGDVRDGKEGLYGNLTGNGKGDSNAIAGLVNPAIKGLEKYTLKYTIGYNAKNSSFDQKHKSLLSGFKSQRDSIKKGVTSRINAVSERFTGKKVFANEHLENKKISGITNDKNLSRDDKLKAIEKELRNNELMKDQMKEHYGTKIERNLAQKGKDWVREGLGGDPNSEKWYGRKQENLMGLYDKSGDKYLSITDAHYKDYAERLLMEAEKSSGISSPISNTPPLQDTPPSPTTFEQVKNSALDTVQDGLKAISEPDSNINGDKSSLMELEKQEAERRKGANMPKQTSVDDVGVEKVDAFASKKK